MRSGPSSGRRRRTSPRATRTTRTTANVWTWVAIDADTKLVPSWLVGQRTMDDCWTFIEDLRGRMRGRIQLSTDGHASYKGAVGLVFGSDIDWATTQQAVQGRAPWGGPLQPANLHRHNQEDPDRQPGPRQGVHELRRAPKPHDAREHAPAHEANQRALQETREPQRHPTAAFHSLQLRPPAQDARRSVPAHTGDGGGACGRRLEPHRDRRTLKLMHCRAARRAPAPRARYLARRRAARGRSRL